MKQKNIFSFLIHSLIGKSKLISTAEAASSRVSLANSLLTNIAEISKDSKEHQVDFNI